MPRQAKVVISREEFENLYIQQQITLEEISAKTGVPRTTLCRWQKQWGIPKVIRHELYTGKRFGKWLVIEEKTGGSRGVQTMCWCLCDCGTEEWVSRGNLQMGLTNSCGCTRLQEPGQGGLNRLIGDYKDSAKLKSLPYTLSEDEVAAITKSDCHYCGAPPQQVRKQRSDRSKYTYNGIDRMDPSIGYVIGNVVPCCWLCNRCKASHVEKDFLDWVSRVHPPDFVWESPREPVVVSEYAAIYKAYQRKAKFRKLEFQLSEEDASICFSSDCAYCGLTPSNGSKRGKFSGGKKYSGIDRVDNSKGYVRENCIPCCQQCNYAKLGQPLETFLLWAQKVSSHITE